MNPVGLSGGLALFWKNSYEVEILRSSSRIIDTKVKAGNLVYYMTFVYGDLVRQRRNEFWTELKSIGLNRNGGWGLVGNFNEFMSSEKSLVVWFGLRAPFISFVLWLAYVRSRRFRALGINSLGQE